MASALLRTATALSAALLLLPSSIYGVAAARNPDDGLPSYLYGEAITVECMDRNIQTGEHVQDTNNKIEWVPFPTCNETNKPLEFHYGHEGELNCTIASISDPFFHLLEFYVHSDAPLSCRLAARPSRPTEVIGEEPDPPTYIPLVFALAGTWQLSHLHVATHINVLLHAIPHSGLGAHKKIRWHDSGALDSAIAYSTGTGSHMDGLNPDAGHTRKVIIGDPLPLQLSVRWLPGPKLPSTEGRVEWMGMPGRVCAGHAIWWVFVGCVIGGGVAGWWVVAVVLPRRRGNMGGATPLGHGLGSGALGGIGGRLGNGWGYAKKKAKD